MANVKISGLPAASTPLTGAELVPIVQSGVTSQTTVDKLTIGKAVTANNFVTQGATSRIDIDSSGTGGTGGYDLLSIQSTNSVETIIGALGSSSLGYAGTYSNHPFRLTTNNIERMRIDSSGNVYGTSGTTTMTNGFFYIPSAGGAPSGTPTAVTGRVPMYYDTTNNQFYVYNGAWKKVTLA